MNHMDMDTNKRYKIKDFLPLIIIFLLIIGFTLIRQWLTGLNWKEAMNDFMGAFFLIFGLFKVINLKSFAEAYSTYDLIAKKSNIYAYLYPFIELILGILYLLRWNPIVTNLIAFIVMSISAIGVAIELMKGKKITCACLGLVFKVPMTYVTLFEDLLMAAMALTMLLF